MAGMHFERMASEYAGARPPYPVVLFETLEAAGVIGPGLRVLEVGAGTGLATEELVRRGSEVVALEPGPALSDLLREAVPGIDVVTARLEDAEPADGWFDSVVAATSLHWVDLAVGLPKIHAALRPGGFLGVWRTVFRDEDSDTEFRARVKAIVTRRPDGGGGGGAARPTMDELTSGGWFEPVLTERWRWSIDLTTDQVRRLFGSFSDWTPDEVEAAGRAVDDLGGQVTEHYQSVLHLLRRTSPATP